MKINFKNIFFLLFTFILCITLTGCFEEKVGDSDKKEEYSLVSTQDRLVFKNKDNYEIYYMGDSVIEKIEKAKIFSSSYYANEYYTKQNALMYKSIKCIDNIVIFEMNDEYLNQNKYLTKTDLIHTMEKSGFTQV